jgi:hypothetical protein
MWICPLCGQKFTKTNQVHSCGDKVLDDFLAGKSDYTKSLFWHFAESFKEMGDVTIHPAKSMIGFAAKTRIAYVIQLGKNFIDVVFPFDRPYGDNLCFRKIAPVPGSQQFNHHFRMESVDDINTEVKRYMKLAYEKGQ